jgi:hypothetical protein
MTGGPPKPRRGIPSPREQRVRRHNRDDVPQDAASECLGSRRQSTALRVGEPQSSVSELFPQDPMLFVEIVDDIVLLLIHPTGERNENKSQRLRQRWHVVKATRGRFAGCRAARAKSNRRTALCAHPRQCGGR